MVPVAAANITRPSIVNSSTCTGTVHVTNSATVTSIGLSSTVTTNSQNLHPTLDTVNAQSTKDVPENDLKIDKSATPEKDDPLPVETCPIKEELSINDTPKLTEHVETRSTTNMAEHVETMFIHGEMEHVETYPSTPQVATSNKEMEHVEMYPSTPHVAMSNKDQSVSSEDTEQPLTGVSVSKNDTHGYAGVIVTSSEITKPSNGAELVDRNTVADSLSENHKDTSTQVTSTTDTPAPLQSSNSNTDDN